jgi:hypothetical protein
MKAEIDINDCRKQLTCEINVRGLRSFRVRMFIVMGLLRIAAWVCPFGMEINET